MHSSTIRLPARLLTCAAVLGAALLTPSGAGAAPIGRISWDDCTPVVVNQDWSGPGVYVHVVSAVGLEVWQAPPGTICMGAVPARASTWGQIKSQYH